MLSLSGAARAHTIARIERGLPVHIKATAVVLMLIVTAGSGGADEAGCTNVVEGTLTCTAKPNGLWKAWFNASGATTLCANADALWFYKGGNIWRYNVRTQQVDAYTSPLTQPAQEPAWRTHALSPDGKFAMNGLLWDGRQWVRLPLVGLLSSFEGLAFDAKGELWALGRDLHRWEGQQWSLGVKSPGNRGLWPFGDKWLMPVRSGFETSYTVLGSAFEPLPEAPTAGEGMRFLNRVYSSANHSYAIFQLPNAPPGGLRGVFEITDTEFVKKVEGRYVGLDLARDEFLSIEWPAVGEADGYFAIKSPTGQKLAVLPHPSGVSFENEFFRDANGHYWLGPFRHDGTQWQAMLPPSGLLFVGGMRNGLRSGRLKYDQAQQTWVDAWPEVPPYVAAYDRDKRTGWLSRRDNREAPLVVEKFLFQPGQEPKRITSLTVDTTTHPIGPLAFEADGQLWFRGAYRWDGQEFHYYYDGFVPGQTSQMQSELVKDSTGAIWMYKVQQAWMKYDPQTDQFRPAEPFDAFTFRYGDETLSLIDWPRPGRYRDLLLDFSLIRRKDGNAWKLMDIPFVRADRPDQFGRMERLPLLGVVGRCVRGGRLLVSCDKGVFEQDLRTGRWAFVAADPGLLAYFDDQGRRVLVAEDAVGQIFLFDGETMDLSAPAAPAEENLAARIADLLAGMDDDEWIRREQATREALNLVSRRGQEAIDILQRPDAAEKYSPEARARVAYVLREAGPEPSDPGQTAAAVLAGRAMGNSLLERMHPYPPADIEYVVKPGMAMEHAAAVFAAAGAKSASEISRSSSAGVYCRGYVLPDGTMVYLGLEDGSPAAKIVTIGVGPFGKGYDPKWNWADRTRNATQPLKLQPYLGRGPRRR